MKSSDQRALGLGSNAVCPSFTRPGKVIPSETRMHTREIYLVIPKTLLNRFRYCREESSMKMLFRRIFEAWTAPSLMTKSMLQ